MVNEKTKAAAKTVANAGGKFLLVGALPAIASAYFTYKTAQVEAQVKIAEAQAKMTIKAEAGYEVMVKKIDWLETRVAALEERPAHEEPRPVPVRRPATRSSGGTGSLGAGGLGAGSIGVSVGVMGSNAKAQAPLPRTLDDAVKASGK
jgi:hypothetical protein